MNWISFLLFFIYIKLSFARPLGHRKSVDLPPDRAGVGVGSGRNSQPQQLILKWCPLGMGEKEKKKKKNSTRFILFLQLSTVCGVSRLQHPDIAWSCTEKGVPVHRCSPQLALICGQQWQVIRHHLLLQKYKLNSVSTLTNTLTGINSQNDDTYQHWVKKNVQRGRTGQ